VDGKWHYLKIAKCNTREDATLFPRCAIKQVPKGIHTIEGIFVRLKKTRKGEWIDYKMEGISTASSPIHDDQLSKNIKQVAEFGEQIHGSDK
jgi:hypothetical protein